MTKSQLGRLCKKHNLTKLQHTMAQIIRSMNGEKAAKTYVEAIVAARRQD